MTHIDFAEPETRAAPAPSAASPASAPSSPAATPGFAAAAPRPAAAVGALPDHVLRIRVDVEIVLGQLRLPLAEVMALREGAVLPLERRLGDFVDVMVNGRLVARGEVVALEDEPDRLGVVIRELTRAGESVVGR